MKTDMTYLQMCIGFILGYFLVGFLLLPLIPICLAMPTAGS